MAANCNIIRDNTGEVISTEAPNGNRSILFDSLVNKLQNSQEALKVWLVSRTKGFQESIINPIKQRGKILPEKVTSPIKVQKSELMFENRVNPFTGEDTGQIELALVKTNPEDRGQGLAKKAIGKFLDYTDTIGKPTYLTVSPREAGVSEEGLIKLYESFGYKLEPTGFEMVRPVGKRKLPKILEGLDENGEPRLDVLLNYIDNRSEMIEDENTDESTGRMKERLEQMTYIPPKPEQTKDKYGRITSGKVHLYHSTNGLENLENIRRNGLDFEKQTAVQGLFFSKLGSPYRKDDSFVVIETDVSNIPWNERIEGQEVALGQLNNYKIIHTSEFSPRQLDTLDFLKRSLEKEGLDKLEVSVQNYAKYNEGDAISVKVLEAIKEVKGQKPMVSKVSKAEIAEYKDVMMGIRVRSTTDLMERLQSGFMPNGYFNPTRESLSATNLYNGEEITDILTNTILQEKVRSFVYKLSNIDGEVLNDIYSEENFLVVEDGSKNGMGKFKLANPYLVEKKAIDILGGIKDRMEFEEVLFNNEEVSMLATPYLETQGTKEDLFNKFKEYSSVGVVSYESGGISSKLNNTRAYMEQVLVEPETTLLEDNLDYLINLDGQVFGENQEAVTKLIKEVTKEMINIGLDVTNLEDVMQGKSVGEFKEFLQAVSKFIKTETDQAFDNLVGTYNDFFEVNTDFKFKNIIINDRVTPSNSFYLKTEASEVVLFVEAGLIPIGRNTYKRISKETPLDEVYENVYTNTVTNGYNNILSDEAVRPTGYDSDGTLNLDKVRDPSNKEAIIRDMKAYIQTQISDIYVGDNSINQEDLERYALMFNYINRSSDLNKFNPKPIMSTEYGTFIEEIGNQQYLKTDFISDFNKKMLKEKVKDSVEYKEFYSNFEINELGITLVNQDPISISKIDKYIEDNRDLSDYLKLHKQGFDLSPEVTQDPMRDDLFLRNYYTNFPTEVKPFKGSYTVLSKGTILAETKESFIRTSEGLFELVVGTGNKGVYGRLNTQDGLFKVYNTSLNPPTLDIDISEISALDTNPMTEVEVNNLYSEEEKNQIDNEYDNC